MSKLTILEMHHLIEQEVQKMGFFAYSNLETEEIDLQINSVIDKFVEDVLDKKSNKRRRLGVLEGFQENQVSLDKLRTIHVKDQTGALQDFDGGKKITFENDYLHFIKAKAVTSYTCTENKKTVTKTLTSGVRIMASTDIDAVVNLPHYKTDKRSPIGEIVNNSLYLYTDSTFAISSLKYDYIRKPVSVLYAKNLDGSIDIPNCVDCDLPASEHRKIVADAALKIMKIIESNPQKILNIQQEVN